MIGDREKRNNYHIICVKFLEKLKMDAVMELPDKRLNSLNDDDLSRRVLEAFHIFRKTSLFCDVILKICGYEVPAHACILAAGSQYFNTFLSQPAPRQYSQIFPQLIEIQIDGSDPSARYEEAVYSVIDFIYTGKLVVNERNILPQIRELSKIMQLDDLVNFCNDLLLNENAPKVVNLPRLTRNDNTVKISVGTQADLSEIEEEINIKEEKPKTRRRGTSRRKKKPSKVIHVASYDSDTDPDYMFDGGSESEVVNVVPERPERKAKRKIPKIKLRNVKSVKSIKVKREPGTKPMKPRRRPVKSGVMPLLSCSECDFRTEKFRILAKHKDVHLNEKSICRFCERHCKDQDEWREHVQTHEGTHPYVCTYCEKTFKCR